MGATCSTDKAIIIEFGTHYDEKNGAHLTTQQLSDGSVRQMLAMEPNISSQTNMAISALSTASTRSTNAINANLSDSDYDIDERTGMFVGMDFDVDVNASPDNEDDFRAYIERGLLFEKRLKQLHERTSKLPAGPLPPNITYCRPFLSSTFKDFNEERNLCFKSTFPKLEKLCLERGIFFAPLDLRWGVTTEQSSTGYVIKLCLEEIDRSRPYFVCSLGFRNGWSLYPTDDPNDEAVKLLRKTFEIGIEQYPWVAQCWDKSVTELEILHGALNNPSSNARAYFYFREVEFLKSLPANQRKTFIEMGHAEKNLMKLKIKIVRAGFKVQFSGSPTQMTAQLERDLAAGIQNDFPVQQLTPLERQRKQHAAFEDSRSRIFVGGKEYMQKLDEYLLGEDSTPFVVSGNPGSGKSAVVSNWLRSVRERIELNKFPGRRRDSIQNDQFVAGQLLNWNRGIVSAWHIGATSDSNSPASLLNWVLQEIKNAIPESELDISNEPREIINAFPEWLQLARADQPLLLVFDGIDQLPREDDQLMHWLPYPLPKSVRIVFTCSLDSPAFRTLSDGQCSVISMKPLQTSEELQLIKDFLTNYGKSLDQLQEQKIIDSPRTSNPLYLITFLQEVRAFGSYENLNSRIDYYMDAVDVADMFSKVIGRLEDDFDPQVPNLVRYTLSILLVSRHGLSENELKGAVALAIASKGNFPNLEFSALMLRLDEQLVDLHGLRQFSQSYMRQAVSDRYFRTNDKWEVQELLVNFFESQPLSERVAEELPYHVATIIEQTLEGKSFRVYTQLDAAYNKLKNIISNIDMFMILNSFSVLDLHKYWRVIERKNSAPDYAAKEYTKAIQQYYQENKLSLLEFADLAAAVGTFLTSTDRYYGAELLLDQALELRERELPPNDESIEVLITKKANLMHRLHKFDDALILYQRALTIAETRESASIRRSVLTTSIADLLKEQRRFTESEPLYRQSLEEKISLLGERHPIVAISMSNLADLYMRMMRPNEALPLYLDAMNIMEAERGRNHPHVASIVSNLASCFLQLKDYDQAIKFYERARKCKEDTLGSDHVAVSVVINSLGAAYFEQGQYEKALRLYERSLHIRQSAYGKTHPQLAPTLSNIALVYLAQFKHSIAISYFNHALTIIETANGKQSPDLIPILKSVSKVYSDIKDFHSVIQVNLRMLDILDNSSDVKGSEIQPILNDIGMAYQTLHDFRSALPYHVRELFVLSQLYGLCSAQVADVLMILGVIHVTTGENNKAKLSFHRCYAIRKQLFGEHDDATLEARGWIVDLIDDVSDIDWNASFESIENPNKYIPTMSKSSKLSIKLPPITIKPKRIEQPSLPALLQPDSPGRFLTLGSAASSPRKTIQKTANGPLITISNSATLHPPTSQHSSSSSGTTGLRLKFTIGNAISNTKNGEPPPVTNGSDMKHLQGSESSPIFKHYNETIAA